MRFPRSQTYPAELGFAILVPTNHVIAAAVLLNSHVTLWTLLLGGEGEGESTVAVSRVQVDIKKNVSVV